MSGSLDNFRSIMLCTPKYNATMTPHPKRDLAVINAAGCLRSFGVGWMGVVLGIYLFRSGLSSTEVGFIIAVGLAGSASATILMTLLADRIGRKWFLVFLSLLSGVGGVALALLPRFPVLASMAFIGMLNGTGTDRSAAFAMDQAIVPGLVSDTGRTWGLAWYNVLLDGGGSLGALGAGLPLLLEHQMSLGILTSYRLVFLGYAILCVVVATIYLSLSRAVEIASPNPFAPVRTGISPESKRVVAKITTLFSLDAFGGGFLTDALVAYWFFRRFGIAEQELGVMFFAVHLLNACSHLGAAWLARRIGLVNTMVFTHLPSSLFLIAVPFAPSFKWAAALFLCREAPWLKWTFQRASPTWQEWFSPMKERLPAESPTSLAICFGPLARAWLASQCRT
jgi:predicted MFS family arabinose efflux permease